jgi:ligand-binding sensor domain-containing protein
MRTQFICLALAIVLLCPFASAQQMKSNGPYGGSIHSFAVSGTNLFVGTGGGGVFLSTDNGSSWTEVNSGLMNTCVYSLAVSGTNLIAGTNGGVFLSTNNGTSWTSTGPGFAAEVFSLAVSGTNLFAGTIVYGIFLSTNNGRSWTAASAGLTNKWVWSLAVSGTNLFAGTYGGGLWRRSLSQLVDVKLASREVPAEFTLAQNFPNPFNPSTTIKYELPKASDVRLSVFDILGREVSVLVNERRDAGVHEEKFDGSNLASGLYLYRLQARDFVQTRKLLLVR